jgi:photosystem II stability/assembly factor-like uncharacterized protein
MGKGKIKLLLSTFLFILNLYSQNFSWQHTGGPMGGVVGDMAFDKYGNLLVGVYGWINITWSDFKSYSGIYKTTNGGNNWFELINQQFNPFEVHALYVTKKGDIFVGTRYQGRIYRSTDNGQTWVNNNSGYTGSLCMAFGESKDGILVSGDGRGGLFRSTNNGDSWQYITNINVLAFATDSNNTIWCGALNGLFKSTDGGLTWTGIDMFTGLSVSTILVDKHGNIFVGTGYYNMGMGVYLSKNGGETWESIGLYYNIILSLAMDSRGKLFAGTATNGLYSSTNLGVTWVQHLEGIKDIEVFRLKIDSNDYIFIGSENEGVFRSTNGGDSFEQVGLPISHIQNIDISPDKNYIFAATPSGVQRFDRTKRIWENIGFRNVEAVSVSPSGILYAATYNKGVYKSTNNGLTWNILNLQPSIRYNFKAINDSVLIDINGYSVLRSTNFGVSWDTINIVPDVVSSISRTGNKTVIYGFSNYQAYIFYSDNYFKSFNRIPSPMSSTSTRKNGLIIKENGEIFLLNTTGNLSPGVYRCSITNSQWVQKFSGICKSILVDSNNVIYVGSEIGIIRSFNNGDTWDNIFNFDSIRTFAQDLKLVDNILLIATNAYGLYELQLPTNVEEGLNTISNFICIKIIQILLM